MKKLATYFLVNMKSMLLPFGITKQIYGKCLTNFHPNSHVAVSWTGISNSGLPCSRWNRQHCNNKVIIDCCNGKAKLLWLSRVRKGKCKAVTDAIDDIKTKKIKLVQDEKDFKAAAGQYADKAEALENLAFLK